jgi:hypothetical protein
MARFLRRPPGTEELGCGGFVARSTAFEFYRRFDSDAGRMEYSIYLRQLGQEAFCGIRLTPDDNHLHWYVGDILRCNSHSWGGPAVRLLIRFLDSFTSGGMKRRMLLAQQYGIKRGHPKLRLEDRKF